MKKKSSSKKSSPATAPSMRAIDMSPPEPNRTNIAIKPAENGGYVVEHHGVNAGKYYSKTHVAHSKEHLQKMVTKMAC